MAVLALAGCAHDQMGPTQQPNVVAMAPQPYDTVGHTHEPYRGRPKYLAEARPMLPENQPAAGAPNPCQTRSATCDERLRAVLASIEAQILAMQTPPTALELQSLRLSVLQLTPLLTPYPDMMSERDELGQLIEKLPETPPAQQGAIRNRMTEVTDLLRIQLAGAQ